MGAYARGTNGSVVWIGPVVSRAIGRVIVTGKIASGRHVVVFFFNKY